MQDELRHEAQIMQEEKAKRELQLIKDKHTAPFDMNDTNHLYPSLNHALSHL